MFVGRLLDRGVQEQSGSPFPLDIKALLRPNICIHLIEVATLETVPTKPATPED